MLKKEARKYLRFFIKSGRSACQNRFSITLIIAGLTRCYQDCFVKSRRIKFLRASQIARDVKTIVEYIIFDFKNVVSNDYKNQTTFISSKLKNVEFRRKDERLIKNVSKIVFFKNKYVLSLNICSISLSDKKITASFRKSLMNVFNTLTSFSRIARFILSKFVQFVVRFLNLSSQSISKIIEKQVEKVLHEELKSFLAKKKILSSRKIVVDNRFQIIEETSQSEQSFKAFSLSFFFLSFAAIKLHVDVKKKMKRVFDATIKFVFKKSKRNVSICTCEKMNSMIL